MKRSALKLSAVQGEPSAAVFGGSGDESFHRERNHVPGCGRGERLASSEEPAAENREAVGTEKIGAGQRSSGARCARRQSCDLLGR